MKQMESANLPAEEIDAIEVSEQLGSYLNSELRNSSRAESLCPPLAAASKLWVN